MLKRQLQCPSCGVSWDASTARFCGSCGAWLHATPEGQETPTGDRRSADGVDRRILLLAAVTGAVLITGLALLGGGSLESPQPADDEVTLPDDLGPPTELTPEQREALEGFAPDRPRCEPVGCETFRLTLDTAITRIAVGHGWLAVLDGAVLRVRPLGGDDAPRVEEMATNEVIGGAGASRQAPPPPEREDLLEPGPERDHDLTDRFARLDDRQPDGATPPGDATDHLFDTDHLDILATPPEQLTLLDDGGVVLRWLDRLALLEHDGSLRWELAADSRTFRSVEVVGDRLLVLRDDLAWPEGTTGPRASSDPIVASVHDLADGEERWRRYTLAPRDLVADGLLITTVEDAIELIDLDDGVTRWRRASGDSERIQSSTGPWIVLTRSDRAIFLDPETGREVASRDSAALLTPIHPIGGSWVAAWIEGRLGQVGGSSVAIVALDDGAEERWRVPLVGLGDAACCPAAIPWVDDTAAIYDPASPVQRWRTVDAGDGTSVRLPEDAQPRLPLSLDEADHVFVSSAAGDRIVQRGEDRIAIVSALGSVSILGSSDLEVVSLDPLVVIQGTEVLAAQPVAHR